MSSLLSLVRADGPIEYGEGVPTPSQRVRALQLALSQAGYKIGADGVYDGIFGPGTKLQVTRFQRQHRLDADGICGKETANLLDQPHDILIAVATPEVHASGFPHDDTASLIAFYGNPDSADFSRHLVDVASPFPLTYDGKPWLHPMRFHARCAPAFQAAFNAIWDAAGRDLNSPVLKRIRKFSGSWNNRSVRGSSRKSCHAFAAAGDWDADELPLGVRVDASAMPAEVIATFDRFNLFWGGRFVGRPDSMHAQAAHEG